MTNILNLTPARLKRVASSLRNTPLFALTACVSVAIEMFAWGGIFAENAATVEIAGFTVRLAYAEAIMSISFSLAALVLAGAAAAQKADPRRSQNKRAWATQILAIVVLIAPVYYAGNCVALNRQLAEWREYHGSAAEAADIALANDAGADSMARADAAENLKAGIKPLRAEFDPAATLWIGFLLGANMLAVRLGWRARPETPAETKARLAADRAHKAARTRALNKQLETGNVTALRRA